MRIIDADTLLKEINERYKIYSSEENPASTFVAATLSYVADEIKDAPTIRPHEWILCSEKLPEPDESVLVYTVTNNYYVWDATPHHGVGYEWEDEEGFFHDRYEVEMWMPLPEPYI